MPEASGTKETALEVEKALLEAPGRNKLIIVCQVKSTGFMNKLKSLKKMLVNLFNSRERKSRQMYLLLIFAARHSCLAGCDLVEYGPAKSDG